jgi:hypothetical protein
MHTTPAVQTIFVAHLFYRFLLGQALLKASKRRHSACHHVVFHVRLKVCSFRSIAKKDTFFPQYVQFFKALDYVNLLSLILVLIYCLLWITVLYRCPKTRTHSRYVIGTAVALVLWHIPEFITLVAKPKNVLCQNEITRASMSNHLCAAQGTMLTCHWH